MPSPTMPIFRNEDDLAPLPASERIRYRLVGADCRYHANDNIAAYIKDGEIDELKAEVQAHMQGVLEANAAIAAGHGHPMPAAFMAQYRALFSDASSLYATSMLRDVEAGNRGEGEHILGFLAVAADRAGVAHPALSLALLHARAYENRRAANRLPGG